MQFNTLIMLIIGLSCCVCKADEIQLKQSAQCNSSIVRLKDIALVHSTDRVRKQALESIELFPAPAFQKMLSANELRQLLADNNVDLIATMVTGARHVKILGKPKTIRTHLRSTPTIHGKPIRNQPSGPAFQQSSNHAQDSTRAQKQIVDLRQVIVARVPIQKGEIVTRDHLTWAPAKGKSSKSWVSDLNQVIGLQALRPIGSMRPLQSRDFTKAILVKRNRACKVLSKIGSVTVSTSGKAKQDGALGEIVQVQSLDRKRTYFGKVTGPQTITVSPSN